MPEQRGQNTPATAMLYEESSLSAAIDLARRSKNVEGALRVRPKGICNTRIRGGLGCLKYQFFGLVVQLGPSCPSASQASQSVEEDEIRHRGLRASVSSPRIDFGISSLTSSRLRSWDKSQDSLISAASGVMSLPPITPASDNELPAA